MFSKSALDDFSNWQICTCFGCFCTLIRRKREICQTFSPSFRDGVNRLFIYKSFKTFFMIRPLASLMVLYGATN